MEFSSFPPSNVIRFPARRSGVSSRCDQKSLMDAVYAAGSLPIAAEDRATKDVATRLTIFGFVVLDEVQADGTVRRLRPSEAVQGSLRHPWRISRPSGRYAVGNDLPASDLDLFAAQMA